ncbi:hypothetical protein HPB48_010215 [Haemaphysalis longicornis]|uniref:Uncharacterized protein n=1 Tax=Haemaphysalis longicornis TaxID=44386 RepID=A0A9J6GC79_HAELO|nr:hypothetical protein HPB48_010215 [Haemaphysalis longicornis]
MEKPLGAKAAGAAGAVAAIASSPEQRAAGVSTQRVGATVKMVTVVEGEAISSQEHADPTVWLPFYCRAFSRAQQIHLATLTATGSVHQGTESASPSPPAVSSRTGAMSGTPPPPKTVPKYRPASLLKDDIKILIRPRDGLNVANHSGTTLFNVLRQAVGLTLEETRGDHLSVNLVQNLVLSSPNPDRAENDSNGGPSAEAAIARTTPTTTVIGLAPSQGCQVSHLRLQASLPPSRLCSGVDLGRSPSAVVTSHLLQLRVTSDQQPSSQLREAKEGLVRRRQRQKHNRPLQNKTEHTEKEMIKLRHKSSGSVQELLRQLQEICIPSAASVPTPNYTGGPKETLDCPITVDECGPHPTEYEPCLPSGTLPCSGQGLTQGPRFAPYYPVRRISRTSDREACVAVVVNSRGDSVASCSVSMPHPEVGEEVVITLALTAAPATAIISNSQTALRNFAMGRVSPITARILQTAQTPPGHCPRLIWTPDDSSLPGNELANEVAREFCCGDASDAASRPRAGGSDRLLPY